MDITLIRPEDIDEVWDFVEPLVSNPKVTNNWVSVESIYNDLKAHKADLWVNMNLTGVCIGSTYFRLDSSKTYIVHYMASTESEDWAEVIQPIEQQARDWGCTAIQVKGRVGWKKALPEYKLEQITLERTL